MKSTIINKYGIQAVHESEHFELEGALAVVMIERWGMIAAVEDGEDSSGRSKLRALTPEELVTRAFDTAKLAMARAREAGLVLEIAPPVEHEIGPITE